MGFLKFLAKDKNTVEVNKSANTKLSDKELSELITNLRTVSRKASAQLGPAMDVSITSSGIVSAKVTSIQEKTKDLYTQISNASTSIDQIALNVRLFSGIIDKQDAAVSQTGAAMEEMSASVDGVMEITNKKTQAADRLKEIIGQGGERVMSTAKAIEEVTEAINGVAEIIKVINAIAAQTNLLAMNAAIEAAHAGEFGKGFAVVAAEVRKLAESTTANSKAIADSLKSIINQIRDAKEASESAGTTFENIQSEVETFVSAFAEISNSTSELSVGTKKIFNSMDGLKSVSSEISGRSKEITSNAENVNNTLKQIKNFSNVLLNEIGVIEEKVYDVSGAQSGIAHFIIETSNNKEHFYSEMVKDGVISNENEGFNYDLLVLKHQNWLVQLRALLNNRKNNLTADADDYMKCDLGKWIYGEGKEFQNSNYYSDLEKKHKDFHACVSSIINAKQAGNRQLAEEKYAALMENYQAIVSLLDKLLRKSR